ncbi:MAG TPA: hypothetical protein VIV12_25815 [Streptosporangiaceae bacterium]
MTARENIQVTDTLLNPTYLEKCLRNNLEEALDELEIQERGVQALIDENAKLRRALEWYAARNSMGGYAQSVLDDINGTDTKGTS